MQTRYLVLHPAGTDTFAVTDVTWRSKRADGPPSFDVTEARTIGEGSLAQFVLEAEAGDRPPRWVWADTAPLYPELLRREVTVSRCHDLRLAHRILRSAKWTATSALAAGAAGAWDGPAPPPHEADGALFEANEVAGTPAANIGVADLVSELHSQCEALESAAPGARERLRLLVAAESAGALVAAEMTAAGIPWRTDLHDAILSEALGSRPADGYRPAKLAELARQIQEVLGVGDVNPDSPADLLRGLRRAGLNVDSTRSWELRDLDHPAAALVLRYKKLSRLWTANGWRWLDTWVRNGRFRPIYVVGGVVTGRWASDGGGALQLPHQVRGAVRADEGWTFVVADAAQLEPRILAAISGDTAMARAGRSADMYEGIVESGAVETRKQAKYGMLGAMYGGTQGVSGQVLPNLRRAFPDAIGLVERAAEVGERGGQVTTWLGRTSPRPGSAWNAAQSEGYEDDPSGAAHARSSARSWGRFTRNFVVQGTAAEWALCWLALVRNRLRGLGVDPETGGSPALVFFLHDEVILHTPAAFAAEVATLVREAATEAARLLFGEIDVEFPLSVSVVENYAEAK
ncbi:bifunctional 3'-5' exonuclease/DNA polymerase [Rarobacter faecitabidus]|uniref:DNA-directed DNA polymerase n=1 Tax=Rarobacter faecitabidus TaxID=13243 RepID=A0A542ZXE7_RARFA|nr:bifunctional 3'-5' exonuclease/DNA polymerase [Rarobacter faecitabidus]TQL65033.1 DNA polymerase-1 [Rarobacter faecitabidus]